MTYLPFGNTLLKLGQNIELTPITLLWLRIAKSLQIIPIWVEIIMKSALISLAINRVSISFFTENWINPPSK